MAFPAIAAVAAKALPAIMGAVGGGGAAAGAAGGAGGAGGMLGGLLGGGGGGGGLMSKMKKKRKYPALPESNIQLPPTNLGAAVGMTPGAGMPMQDGGQMGQQMMGAAGKMVKEAAGDIYSGVQGMLMKKNGGKTPSYQAGGLTGMMLDPEALDWIKSQTGGAGGAAQNAMAIPENFMQPPEAPEMTAQDPTQMAGAVQNPPTNTPAQQMGQPMPGQEMPTLQDPMAGQNTPAPGTDMNTGQVEQNNSSQAAAPAQAKSSMASTNPISSVMSIVSQQKDGNDYAKDQEGYTAVTETSDIMGGTMDNLKQGDIIGAGLELVGGIVGQKSQQRKRTRELQIQEGMHDRAQQNQSVYSDPNSVYYSAKDGAPISQGAMKRNIANMMDGGGIMGMVKGMLPFQEGGESNPTIDLSNQSRTYNRVGLSPGTSEFESAPEFVQEGDKSFKWNSSYQLHNRNYPNRKPQEEYERRFRDKAYDFFHPRKPGRVDMTFAKGGKTKSLINCM